MTDNDEAPAFAQLRRGRRMPNAEGMTKMANVEFRGRGDMDSQWLTNHAESPFLIRVSSLIRHSDFVIFKIRVYSCPFVVRYLAGSLPCDIGCRSLSGMRRSARIAQFTPYHFAHSAGTRPVDCDSKDWLQQTPPHSRNRIRKRRYLSLS
jgi:hypothetical protein